MKIMLIIGLFATYGLCAGENQGEKTVEVSCLMPDKITDGNVIGIVISVKKSKNVGEVIEISKTDSFEMRMELETFGGLVIDSKQYQWMQIDRIHNETVLVKGLYNKNMNTIVENNNNDISYDEIKPIKGGISIKVKSLGDENESDSIYCETNIYPNGYTKSLSIVTNFTGNELPLQFYLPSNTNADSFEIKTNIYTSLYTLLLNSCESLMNLRVKNFEIIADIIYSKVLLINYMKSNNINDEKVKNENIKHLEYYYKELLKYQTEDGGFDWFEKSRVGNEGLTAYGLLVLNELKNVIKMDENVINKARKWLLSRQLENGYFNVNSTNLGVVGNSSTTSFIYWVLSEEKKINVTQKFLKYYDSLSDVRNTYILGLIGLTYFNLEDEKFEEDADNMGLLLTKLLREDGSIMGIIETIVGSDSENSVTESTAICMLLYMRIKKFGGYDGFIDHAVNYLYTKNNNNGIIGSTHSTVFALKVFIEYEKMKNIKPLIFNINDNAKIVTAFNNQIIASEPLSNLSSHSLLTITSPYNQLVKENQNSLVYGLVSDNENDKNKNNEYKFKFGLTLLYNSDNSANDENCRVRILYELRKSEIYQDENVDLVIKVENISKDKKLGMVVAVINIPGGLVINDQELSRLVELNAFSSFENKGNELMLYWRGMNPVDEHIFLIHANGAIPGNYKAKSSCIYELYNNNLKWWIDGLSLTIMPRLL